MAVFCSTGIVIFLACLLQSLSNCHAQAYTDATCNIRNGITAHPSRCDTYVLCARSRVFREIKCPQGTRFDDRVILCRRANLVNCGSRSRPQEATTTTPLPPVSDCDNKPITVTINIVNTVRPPRRNAHIDVTAPSQPLKNFLLMAAGMNNLFRFKSGVLPDFGEYVTSLSGIDNVTTGKIALWLMYDGNDVVMLEDISTYRPKECMTVTFRYTRVSP